MSVQLPEKPWTKGDSFKVEETGLTYVWSGEAWLSDGAELPDDLATESYVAEYVTEEVFENATKTVHLRHRITEPDRLSKTISLDKTHKTQEL